jgi:hypothetical protein
MSALYLDIECGGVRIQSGRVVSCVPAGPCTMCFDGKRCLLMSAGHVLVHPGRQVLFGLKQTAQVSSCILLLVLTPSLKTSRSKDLKR